MGRIEVFIIDNSTFFRDGLGKVIGEAKDFKLAGVSDISEEAIELVDAYFPNIVLIDIGLPLLTGLELAGQIKQMKPAMSLVILTSYYDDGHLLQTIKSGASGYLLKETKPDELLLAIRRIHQGEYILTDSVMSRPTVVEKILRQFQDISLNGVAMERLASPLSPRELEILDHKAHGLLNKQVAHMLGISEQTIKNHMSSILRKLEVNDRTQAVVMALRNGWLNTTIAKAPESIEPTYRTN